MRVVHRTIHVASPVDRGRPVPSRARRFGRPACRRRPRESLASSGADRAQGARPAPDPSGGVRPSTALCGLGPAVLVRLLRERSRILGAGGVQAHPSRQSRTGFSRTPCASGRRHGQPCCRGDPRAASSAGERPRAPRRGARAERPRVGDARGGTGAKARCARVHAGAAGSVCASSGGISTAFRCRCRRGHPGGRLRRTSPEERLRHTGRRAARVGRGVGSASPRPM